MRVSFVGFFSSSHDQLSSTSSTPILHLTPLSLKALRTFSTLFPTLLSASSLHQDVAAFYDVPSISVRDVILPRVLADPHTQLPKWFRTGETVKIGDDRVREWGGIPVDLMHVSAECRIYMLTLTFDIQISALGHGLAADLVIHYLKDQISRSKPSSRAFALLGRFARTGIRRPIAQVLDVPRVSLHGNPSMC